jgi:hypothetical protein
MVMGVQCHLQQYFSYIVAVGFIGGGNRKYSGKNRAVEETGSTLGKATELLNRRYPSINICCLPYH